MGTKRSMQALLHLALGCAFISNINFDPMVLFRNFFFFLKPSSHFSRVSVVKTR